MTNQENYLQVDRKRLRQMPWWQPLAFISRKLPVAISEALAAIDLRSGQKLLDFGCADQPYRTTVPEGVSYMGADLPGNRLANIAIDPNGQLGLDDSSVDVVLSTQVLEHVSSPADYLAEAFRVLKPEGTLVLSTHGIMVYHKDPVDYWRWTGEGLEKAVTDAGFVITRFKGVMGLAPSGLQLFQDAVWGNLPAFLRPVFTIFMQGLIAIFDNLHSEESKRLNALVFVVNARKAVTAPEGYSA